MRYLFSARHGHYNDKNGELTFEGLEQIEGLANEIKTIVSVPPCLVFAGEKRVVQTARLLKERLKILDAQDVYARNERCKILDDLAFNAYTSKVNQYDAMIFVSHECPALDNARYLAQKIGFDKKIVYDMDHMLLAEGHALLLDLEQKTFKTIPIEKIIPKINRVQSYENIDLAF